MNQKELAHKRIVGTWIMIGVGMLLIQVILGGITRLTGSGLSITEWNIVTGIFPPLNEQQWLTAFEKYRQTPQYHLLNYDFTLSDFKFIFFWEWIHRLWARLIAVVFLIPFIYFLWKKMFTRQMAGPLIFLFLFGAFQGVIGWIMVQSGLTGDAIYVKPTRLAMHFVFAMALIAFAYRIGLSWLASREKNSTPALRKFSGWIIAVIFLQLVFGSLLAGHKGAAAAATWPDINGSYLPPHMFSFKPWMINFVQNIITIQFIHRCLAYLILILILIFCLKAFRLRGASMLFAASRLIPLWLVLLQVLLGILAILTSPQITPARWGQFEWMAQFHQITGMMLLLSMVHLHYLLKPPGQQP